MRITELLQQSQFLTSIDSLESSVTQTQADISSNSSFTTASENPTAAGEVNNYDQALAQSQQYSTNAQSGQTNLSTENTALTQATSQLQSLRDLALQAANGGLSNTDLNSIATQISQIQQGLVSLANTQNGNGEYIFGGYAAQTQPFSLTATGATYQGDQGQRSVQIGAGVSVPDGDNGDTVFQQIKTGNGTFTVTANPANAGATVVGAATVSNAATYANGTFSINFTSPTTYTVTDAAGNVVPSSPYTSGQSISFDGINVTLSGTPVAGDSFGVAPSTNQSIFATVQNLVTALQAGSTSTAGQAALSNSIGAAINNIDQALSHVSDITAQVGGRLNAITTQQSVSTGQQTQLQSSISTLQGLDYPAAITTLDQENTTLSAALQAYSLTQGLSLFKYL